MHVRTRHGPMAFRAVCGQRKSETLELLERRQMLAAHVVGSSTVYATIQAAVDAVATGGTVTVDPGNYAELVFVEKPMTILGARAGVDARSPNRGIGESVLTGTAIFDGITSSFVIDADNVTLDGFTVQGNTSTTRFGAGVVISPNIAGTQIVNNIIQNNISGLYLSNDSASSAALIQHNLFRNNNKPGQHTGRGIYTDGGYSGGNLTNVTIDANAFIFNTGGLPSASLEAAIDLHAGPASSQTNFRITNNAFDNNGKALLAFNASAILIQNNTITATRDTRSGSLRFEGNVHDVVITGNTIYDNVARGIRIDNNAAAGSNFNFQITGNNIYGNATNTTQGVNHDGLDVVAGTFDGTLDATNNFWGDASGPSGDGPGTGDAVYSHGNSIAFIPWATAPAVDPQVPYFARPFQPGERIDAVYYDHGGEGFAYHDIETKNQGTQLRLREGVDIQKTTDPGIGFNVGWIKAGEWLEYTLDIASAGTYSADFRVASPLAGGTFRIVVDGVSLPGSIAVPATGNWQTFKTITMTGVPLTAGKHTIRLAFDTNGSSGSVGNFNWFKLTLTDPTPPPPPPPTSTVTYIAPGATWKYLDDGSDQGAAWEAEAFSDATWKTGAAQLGYGDGDEATVVSFGNDPDNTFATTYFRNSFTVDDASKVQAIDLRLIRDDGAVVYLNGTEIYRNNMPGGAIIATTFASTTVGGADESTWYAASISPALLKTGNNVIAVEIHQSVPGSSDLSFDFELKATISDDQPPPPSTDLPAPWNHGEVGATAVAGSAAFSGGAFTVKGSGADIWGKADAFHFAHQQFSGDGSIVARVASMEKGDLLAKVGIDIRTSLDAGAIHAGLYVTPANGIKFIRRTATGQSSASTTSAVSGSSTPQWLKLTRTGGTITAYRSTDGSTWTAIGSQNLALGQSVYIGLAVCSHSAANAISATFDNVGVAT